MRLRLYCHSRLVLYDDGAPYAAAAASPSPLAATTSRHTLRHPPPPTLATPFDSSVALTVLILLAALFFMGFFSIYIRRFAAVDEPSSLGINPSRGRRHRNRNPARPRVSTSTTPAATATARGVDPRIIRRLPSYAYGGTATYQIDCPVCLSELEVGEAVRMIPRCRHVFHVQCIDTWLMSHVSCPVCRATQLLEPRSYAAAGPTASGGPSPPSVAAALAALGRCNSCSCLGREETPPVDRSGSLWRTLSF